MKTGLMIAFLVVGACVTNALCQDAAPAVARPTRMVPPAAAVFPVQEPAPFGAATARFSATVAAGQETHQAFSKLKAADNDEDKDKAKEELRDALQKEYDASLDAFEEHLDKLTKQIADLKDQLERRRDAKSEMVRLRLQLMIHEADGLGWPDRSSSFASPFFRPVPTVNPVAPAGTPVEPRRRPGGVR